MDKQEFLRSSGIEIRTLELWIEQRWLMPEAGETGEVFAERDMARASLIRDLTRDFGVNDEGIDVILHLVDQLHGLRRTLDLLREEMSQPPR